MSFGQFIILFYFFGGGMSIDYHLEKAQLDFSRHFPKK
jgi:hypothetical protein